MRYYKNRWKGYLEVHETIAGFSCFLCNDEEFTRAVLTRSRMEELEIAIPRDYKLTYKTREEADKMMSYIAKHNGFSEVLRS